MCWRFRFHEFTATLSYGWRLTPEMGNPTKSASAKPLKLRATTTHQMNWHANCHVRYRPQSHLTKRRFTKELTQ